MWGNSTRSSVTAVPDRRTSARLALAIEHLLGMVRDLGAHDPILVATTRALEEELARATLSEELEAAAQNVSNLRAPPRRVEITPGMELRPVASALGALARRLRLVAVAAEADALGRGEAVAIPQTVVELVERITRSIAETQRAHDILDAGLGEVAEGLSRMRTREDERSATLSASEMRIAAAVDHVQLEQARDALLSEVRSLQLASQRQAQELARLEADAHTVQRRASRVLDDLADAESAARTDPLTALGNRRAMEETVAKAATDAEPWGVLCVDIDFFKKINDQHGHTRGDAVLRHVAGLIRQELRGDDAAFRVGGEEFVVLLRRCDRAGAARTAERIRARIEGKPVDLGGIAARTTVSVGVAQWEAGQAFATSLEKADAALYVAKRAGRNRVA